MKKEQPEYAQVVTTLRGTQYCNGFFLPHYRPDTKETYAEHDRLFKIAKDFAIETGLPAYLTYQNEDMEIITYEHGVLLTRDEDMEVIDWEEIDAYEIREYAKSKGAENLDDTWRLIQDYIL